MASDPNIGPVSQLFDGYFAGVNAHDARAAAAAFDPSSNLVNVNSSTALQRFAEGISTTTDDAVAIQSLSPDSTPGWLDAGLTFRSQQAADKGPDGETCTNWTMVYTLSSPAPGTYLIHRVNAQHSPC